MGFDIMLTGAISKFITWLFSMHDWLLLILVAVISAFLASCSAVVVIIIAVVVIVPGSYGVVRVYGAWVGWRGYEMLPEEIG